MRENELEIKTLGSLYIDKIKLLSPKIVPISARTSPFAMKILDYEDINFKADFSDLGSVWNRIVSEYGFISEEEKEKAKILPEDLFEWNDEHI